MDQRADHALPLASGWLVVVISAYIKQQRELAPKGANELRSLSKKDDCGEAMERLGIFNKIEPLPPLALCCN